MLLEFYRVIVVVVLHDLNLLTPHYRILLILVSIISIKVSYIFALLRARSVP